MDKHKHNNGFTLTEMLAVLFIFICLLGMLPFVKATTHTIHIKAETLRERLIGIQGSAMRDFKNIKVVFQGTKMIYEQKQTDIGMKCEGSVIFHANGNVDRAKTLRCYTQNQMIEIVIQLGSGRIYVKE